MDVNKIISLDICEDSKALEHPWRDRESPIHSPTHSFLQAFSGPGRWQGGSPERHTQKRGCRTYNLDRELSGLTVG